MKKTFILIFILSLLTACTGLQRQPTDAELQQLAQGAGAKWSTYDSLGSGVIASGDDFLLRDVSDTSMAGSGTQKRYLWSDFTTDLDALYWSHAESADLDHVTINIPIGDRVTTPSTGIWLDFEVAFDMTITQATMLCDQSGSMVVDIWVDSYANYPPTDADSITASAPPTVSTAIKSQDATLTGWTTTITEGDTVRINIDSVSTVTQCVLCLKGTKE